MTSVPVRARWRARVWRWRVPPDRATSARSSVDVVVKTRGWPVSSVSITEIASSTGSASIRSCSVSRMSSGFERIGTFCDGVGGRLRAEARRIHQVAVDVPHEGAHLQVRDAGDHTDHDERDEQRQAVRSGSSGHFLFGIVVRSLDRYVSRRDHLATVGRLCRPNDITPPRASRLPWRSARFLYPIPSATTGTFFGSLGRRPS